MRFEVTGLTEDMHSIYLFKLQPDGTQKFVQRPIRKGITVVITEAEKSFHVDRLAAKKIVKIVELPEEIKQPKDILPAIKEDTIVNAEEITDVTSSLEVTKDPVKPRKKRKKKTVLDTFE